MEKILKLKNSIISQWNSCPNHPYKILLIGQTGSGKTSFVNLLCNCALLEGLQLKFDDGKGLKQLHIFNDAKLENVSANPMSSKTSGAKLYNTELFGLKLGMIDTPGFGDSRGFEQDKKNVEAIIESIKQENHINCICFVINGAESRELATLKYVFTAITTILPKQIINNLIVVFTNTEDEFHLNFDINLLTKHLHTSIPDERIFLIDNPYCILEKAKNLVAAKGTELQKETTTKIGLHFLTAVEVLKNLSKQIKNFKPVHTQYFLTLYETKEKIEKNVLKLVTEYKNQINWIKTMETAKKNAKEALDKKQLYANYNTKCKLNCVKVYYTDHKNTICGYPGCYSNCHIRCHLDKSYDKAILKQCLSMGGTDMCQKCKHSYTHHYHNKVQFVTKIEEGDLIDEKMKAEYDKAKNMEERNKILQEQCNRHIKISIERMQTIGKELLSVLDQFHTMSMSRNYCKVLESQIEIIKHHIDGAAGDGNRQDAVILRTVKEELETKLKLVENTLQSIPSQVKHKSDNGLV